MKNINLIHTEQSDVGLSKSTFPDGEIQVKFIEEIDCREEYKVACRIVSPADLFILQQVSDILRRHEVRFSIYIYYLMGMRMDRVMSFLRPFTLKIVAGIVDGLGAESVTVYAPHSIVSEKMFRKTRFKQESMKGLIYSGILSKENYLLVFPDKGAYSRYRNEFSFDYTRCEKVRNPETGKIESIEFLDKNKIVSSTKALVIDDLLDGGGTFVGLAEKAKEINPEIELSLYTDHAVNREGLLKVSKHYDKVYTTNSFSDWVGLPENVKIIDVIRDGGKK